MHVEWYLVFYYLVSIIFTDNVKTNRDDLYSNHFHIFHVPVYAQTKTKCCGVPSHKLNTPLTIYTTAHANILIKVYEIIVHFTLDAATEFYNTPCIQEFPVSLVNPEKLTIERLGVVTSSIEEELALLKWT